MDLHVGLLHVILLWDMSMFLFCTVQTGDAAGCSSNGGIVLTQQSGYLASIVASERHRGTQRCPWVLRVSPGQRVNITLLDFSAVSRTYDTEPRGCRLYAKVCGARRKQTRLTLYYLRSLC